MGSAKPEPECMANMKLEFKLDFLRSRLGLSAGFLKLMEIRLGSGSGLEY